MAELETRVPDSLDELCGPGGGGPGRGGPDGRGPGDDAATDDATPSTAPSAGTSSDA